jgi:hypothetical protein
MKIIILSLLSIVSSVYSLEIIAQMNALSVETLGAEFKLDASV